jgi:hypothetical protein
VVDPRYRQIADDLFGAERDAYAAEVSGPGRKPEQSEPTVEVKEASGLIAAELELAEGSFVVTRRQRRFIDGAPYSLQTTVEVTVYASDRNEFVQNVGRVPGRISQRSASTPG